MRWEIFKHRLSVAQLRVLGDHRGSGYPRIASLSCKSEPTTRDLFWFLVRKWFPPRAGGEKSVLTLGYS